MVSYIQIWRKFVCSEFIMAHKLECYDNTQRGKQLVYKKVMIDLI